MTFNDLWLRIRANVWAERIPSNLVGPAQDKLRAALMDLQVANPWLKNGHRNYFNQSQTFYKCGVSIVPKPYRDAVITRVSVGPANDNLTEKVCCDQNCKYVSKVDMEGLMSYCFCTPLEQYGIPMPFLMSIGTLITPQVPVPLNPNPINDNGFLTPDSTIDQNKRVDRRFFSMWDDFIYIYPWINSDEIIEVEWRGSKSAWTLSDVLPDRFTAADNSALIDPMILELIESRMTADKLWFENRQGTSPDYSDYFRKRVNWVLEQERINRALSAEGRYSPK
jgi:hypothetical protein